MSVVSQTRPGTSLHSTDSRGMRLLMISTLLPQPETNGFTLRTSLILRCLRELGHSVHFLCFAAGNESKGMQATAELVQDLDVVRSAAKSLSSGVHAFDRLRALASALPYAALRYRSREMQERIRYLAASGRFDVVITETSYPAVNLPPDLAVPLILDCHNIEHRLLQRYAATASEPLHRFYAGLEARKMSAWEIGVLRRAVTVLTCSEIDAEFARRHGAMNVAVVPNALDLSRYSPCYESDDGTVLFSGGMDWLPNRDAVIFFVSMILPQLRRLVTGVRFRVAGRNPSSRFVKRIRRLAPVEFTGTVADMRSELARASVCVVPLRIGSGTRLKILEAAALGKAVVSTTLGAEGLSFRNGQEIDLRDRPEEFARAVADLLLDASRRRQMGASARARVEKSYGRPALTASLHSVLQLSATEAALAGRQAAGDRTRS